jgi:hypothetical protein
LFQVLKLFHLATKVHYGIITLLESFRI